MDRLLGAKASVSARWLKRVAAMSAVDSEERELAGTVSGLLYLIGGLTLALFTVLPGFVNAHPAIILLAAGICSGWGLCAVLFVDWGRAPRWLVHLTVLVGYVMIAIAAAASGGALSPAWIYLFFIAVFAASFFPAPLAVAYLIGCVVVHALPLLYDAHVLRSTFLAHLVVSTAAYIVLGGVIIAGKRLNSSLRIRAERLAAEQSSLRRVATAVVGGESPKEIYARVSVEAAALVEAEAAGILRLSGPDSLTVLGSWAEHDGSRYVPGRTLAIMPGSDVDLAITEGRTVRIDCHTPLSPVSELGYRSSIVAPIHVAGRIWGVLAVCAAQPAQLTAGDEERLLEFGGLLATAIASIEDREKLAAQASSDPLTGLANHRTLQHRLDVEVARAKRHGGIISVAVLDVDHFKAINDAGGHDTGDEVLLRLARELTALKRAEDTLGRVGGDEFAWILPETTREEALVAVERARQAVAAAAPAPLRVTISAGICDSRVADEPSELFRLADGALYWSKAHGRNQCWVYDPEVVAELSAQERAERLERSQALIGIRALAKAIDTKDAATREHSERVAEIATQLAVTAGWSQERALTLSEAALVHDVGKIGVPDTLLCKPEPLTPEERSQIQAHAELSAQILEGVLSPEQVQWVRTHHERPDGTGYPRGLRRIPEGGALLALADAWDTMTAGRPYSVPKSAEDALAECVSLAGVQFSPRAVQALVKLHRRGQVAPPRSVTPYAAAGGAFDLSGSD
jgi:diguanylate cyclase (GGDEF)-like protein